MAIFTGTSNNETLTGTNVDDTLEGLQGDDNLNGGLGDDQYIFNIGDGQDTITDDDGYDYIYFGAGISTVDLSFSLNGDDLVISYSSNPTDVITIVGYNGAGTNQIEYIEFEDEGNQIYLENLNLVLGDGGDNSLIGTSSKDLISGSGGNDILAGGDRDDFLFGGEDNDTLTGGAGADKLFGGDGNDDYVYNIGDGRDVITDTGGALDTIQFGAGIVETDIGLSLNDGNLTVRNLSEGDRFTIIDQNGTGKIEKLVFDDGSEISFEGVNLVTASGGTLRGTAGDDYLFANGDNNTLVGSEGNDILDGRGGNDRVSYVNADNGVTVDLTTGTATGQGNDTLISIEKVSGSEYDDNITGNTGEDSIQGNGGNDIIYGLDGDDSLNGANGNDELHGGGGVDYLTGEDGNDILHGGSENDELYGGQGFDILDGGTGDDVLEGGSGNDVLEGGTGNDELFGGDGNDQYVYNIGDGQDTISDDYGINDYIFFGAGIAETDLIFTEVGSDLIITFVGAPNDEITIEGHLNAGSESQIERLVFNDSSELILVADNFVDLNIIGTENDDFLEGKNGNDVISGLGGNDNLFGEAGDDILDGGADRDTARFNNSDSGVTVDLAAGTATGFGNDTLISIEDVIGSVFDDIITGNTEANYFRGGDGDDTLFGLENDDELQGREGDDTLYGGEGNDVLYGGDNDDEIHGDANDDELDGGRGHDVLEGSTGNDTLYGGEGNDEFIFNIGDGQDNIYEENGADFIRFGAGINAADLVFTEDGDNLVITFASSPGDKITLLGQFSDLANQVEKIVFDDGSEMSTMGDGGGVAIPEGYNEITGTSINDYIAGTDGNDGINGLGRNDILIGNGGDDLIYGGTGNDQLHGNDGSDKLFGGSGDDQLHGNDGSDELFGGGGNDLLSGSDGNDILDGGDGDDILYAGNQDDELRGGDGNDLLSGSNGEDDLFGGSGDDTLWGGNENDRLEGGSGNDFLRADLGHDILEGGTGNDTTEGGDGDDEYIFNIGDGQDVIYDELGANDFIHFGPGITVGDLILTNNGGDLVITFTGTPGDQITITDHNSLTDNQIEKIVFDDGSELALSGFNIIAGTALGEALSGTSGADLIFGNDGNDQIRGGEDQDIIYSGAGDDEIVVVGTTTLNQYTVAAITNSGGSGTDLSGLITLADLNNRGVSEAVAGEVIDGGAGTNTLHIYGTVDLTGVTLNNVTSMVVNSDVTLTAEQLAQFTSVDGDGSSVINIEIPPGSTDTFIIDLTAIDTSDIDAINITGDITIKINDTTDISGIGNISVASGAILKLDIVDSGTDTEIDLGELSDVFGQVDIIEIAENITLKINTPEDITNLGLSEITGTGDVDPGGSSEVLDALGDINIDPAINTAPVAQDDNFDGIIGEQIQENVILNDNDVDGDDLTVQAGVINTAQGGTVTLLSSGEFTYEAADGFYGEDSFDYLVDDGQGGIDTATATLSVKLPEDVIIGDNTFYNRVKGSADDDVIIVSGYYNKVFGKDGDDIILGSEGRDIVFGGDDNDIILGGGYHDSLYGGRGNDTIRGGEDNDLLIGGRGEDNLSGDEGNDTILGGKDADILIGGQGFDYLVGGSGGDSFVFNHLGDSFNTVADFSISQGDTIDLSSLLEDYDSATDDITDFVQITTQDYWFGQDSIISVDADGGGDGFEQVGILYDTSNLTDELALELSGTLIVV